MTKDPAFLFYSSDFLTGIMFMSMEERGQYITILCLLHQHGGCLPLEEIEKAVGKVLTPVLKKLRKNQHGYYNERLTLETKKRNNFCKSRSKNRLGKKDKKNICKTYVKHKIQHMEVENENKDEDIIEELKKKKEYKHININKELQKMDTWLDQHPARSKTKKFITSWLDKVEVELPREKKVTRVGGGIDSIGNSAQELLKKYKKEQT